MIIPSNGDVVITAAPGGTFLIGRANANGLTDTLETLVRTTRRAALQRACAFVQEGRAVMFFGNVGAAKRGAYECIDCASLDPRP